MRTNTTRAPRIAGLITLGLAGALLAGCAGPASTDGGEGEDGPVTLTWWDYYGASDTIRGIAVEDALARYSEENPDVTIERRNIPRGDYTRTLLQSATAGELPDVMIAANWETAGYAEAGIAADVSDYVAEWGQEDAYYPAMWELTQYEDKTFGVPHFADAYAVWYNTAIFEEAGLEPPTTWEELGETAAALTEGTRYGIAFSAITGGEGANAFLIRAIGAGAEPEEFSSPDGVRALEQWQELVDTNAVSPGALNWTEDDVKDQFISGNAAMMINSATYVAAMPQEAPDLEWAIAPVPVDKVPATLMQSDNLAIGEGSEHEQAAWDLIEWFQTPEALNEYLPERGKLPARVDVAETEQWATDPVFSVFTEALAYGWAPTGKLAEAPEFFPNVQLAVQAALSGGDPEAALEELDAKTAQLLAE